MLETGTLGADIKNIADDALQKNNQCANSIQNMNVNILMTLWTMVRIDKYETASRFEIMDVRKLDILLYLDHQEVASVAPSTTILNKITPALTALEELYEEKVNPSTRLNFTVRMIMSQLPETSQ